jgi:DNA-binding IclR family transcriptional regulator
MGRAYLAFCGDSERERLVSRLAANPEPWNDLAQPAQV